MIEGVDYLKLTFGIESKLFTFREQFKFKF